MNAAGRVSGTLPVNSSFVPRLTLPSTRSDVPSFHPDCCLSLSKDTIHQILDALPFRNTLVLSIGSGTGLLEGLLSEAESRLRLEVVEVRGVNKYMPEEMLHIVQGTWQICERARMCDVLLFVYPREPGLVKKYLDSLSVTSKVQTLIWIGPTVDWFDFERIFSGSKFLPQKQINLSPFELLAINCRV